MNITLDIRCRACDDELTDTECTVKNDITNDYEDMCKECLTESKQNLEELIDSKD